MLILNIGEIQNFAKLLMILMEFRSKFTKFWGNSWISSQAYKALPTGFPVSSMAGVWIFSGIAQCSKTQDSQNTIETPGRVLTVILAHYKLEAMLELNKAFIPAKRIFSGSFLFSRKIAFVQ